MQFAAELGQLPMVFGREPSVVGWHLTSCQTLAGAERVESARMARFWAVRGTVPGAASIAATTDAASVQSQSLIAQAKAGEESDEHRIASDEVRNEAEDN